MVFTLSGSTVESFSTHEIRVFDVNNDGDMDFVAYNYYDGPTTDGHDIYSNDGNGSFSRTNIFGSANDFHMSAVGDINGDGFIDLAVVGNDDSAPETIRIYYNDKIGDFTEREITTTDVIDDLYSVIFFDVDNDGDMDIVIADANISSNKAVWINDGHGNFTEAASTLPASTGIVFADFNSDGYVDIALARTNLISVMRGSGTGAFVASFTQSPSGDTINFLAAGDIDGDGDIDIVTVTSNATDQLNPWFNNGAATTFTAGTSTNTIATPESIALADLDTDGDLDALVGGGGGSQAYLNNGSGVFTPSGSALGATDGTRDVQAGDFDADGDLDFVAGNEGGGAGKENRIYANDQAATLPNTAPTAPSSLSVVKVSDNGSTATVRLSWGSGSDTQTATRLLQYQLRVGTGASANNIISGKTASSNWVTRMMPNGQSKTMLLKNIPCNKTFYWSAASVDTGFKTTWATETTFTVDSSCSIASATSSTGGGTPAWWFRQGEKKPKPVGIINGTITVSAFTDIIRNGVHDPRESNGFTGLSVTASGRTLDGTAMLVTQNLDQNGETTFSLPPSDSRGYWISVASGSDILKSFEPTTDTLTGTSILRANKTLSLGFGFIPEDLIRYVPCMDIGEPSGEPPSDTEASKLLVRLQDSFRRPILRGISLTGALIDRKNFYSALQRTHCLPLETNAGKLTATLRKTLAGRLVLPLIDLPLDLRSPDSTLLYSLLSLNVHAERPTQNGPAADLSSPITRREAIQSIADVLNVPSKGTLSPLPAPIKFPILRREALTHQLSDALNVSHYDEMKVSKGTAPLTVPLLPLDLDADDPLVPAYLALKDLGILPEYYSAILGPSQGITPSEASILLARAAFRGGKITLLSTVLGQSKKLTLKPAPKTPTFLSQIPDLTVPACLTKTAKRAKEFSFSDILPGHALSPDILALLERSTKNTEKRPLWLLTGTTRPTEFGVERGLSKLNLQDSPSVLEVIRNLLVLSCLPPDTPKEALSKVFMGSPLSKVPRDMISGLPRDSSFASRTLFKAQDHQKEYDLSLFTYAPELLRKEERPPAAPLTLEEASSLLASALLRMAVMQDLMTPQAAEQQASALRHAIAEGLLGSKIDWTDERALELTAFTREMFIRFLATVVQRRLFITPSITTRQVSLGEIWWERVR